MARQPWGLWRVVPATEALQRRLTTSVPWRTTFDHGKRAITGRLQIGQTGGEYEETVPASLDAQNAAQKPQAAQSSGARCSSGAKVWALM